MARIRTVKPEFFKSDDLADLSPLHRLLFIGLWCLADREGRLEDKPRRIKAELLPYDTCDVSELLDQLAEAHFIQRYVAENVSCIVVTNFKKHQRINGKEAEQQSALPALPLALSGEEMGKHPGSTRNPRKGREGKGREEYPLTPKGDDVALEDEATPEPLPFSEPPNPSGPDQEPEFTLTTPARLRQATPAPKPKKLAALEDNPAFAAFRAAYIGPRCQGWAAAQAVWKQAGLDDEPRRAAVMQALEEDKASVDWKKEGGAFIPAPAVWLRKQRWLDVQLVTNAPNPYQHKPWGDLWTQAGFPASEVGVMNFCAQVAPTANPHEAGQLFTKGGLDLAASWVLERRGAC